MFPLNTDRKHFRRFLANENRAIERDFVYTAGYPQGVQFTNVLDKNTATSKKRSLFPFGNIR
jgi:hypothetical protein